MTTTGFILRNALRNKRRLILTIASVAVSLFLFTTLQTALKIMTQPPTTEQAALRIVVRHRVSLANLIPIRYRYRIEQIEGVEYCSAFTWFGGIYQDESKSNFAQFACDPDRIFHIFTDIDVAPNHLDAFRKERTACIVGKKLLERFGWKIGDRITLTQGIFPCDAELIIRGVYTPKTNAEFDETILFFRHDYFDELLNKFSQVGTFWIKVRTAEDVPRLIEQIDASFRNTSAETKTETERAFQLGFISMFGNIKLFLGSICTVIVFTMLLVSASTMSMAIRERAREIAILKALGYNGSHIFGLILAESLGLAVTGGLIGCVGAKLFYSNVDIYKLSQGNIPFFPVDADVIAIGLLVALLLGVVSALAPAWSSARTTVVEGLRTLD